MEYDSSPYTFGSVFSGCGAMDLGFERAGWQAKWKIEIDANCRKVLCRSGKPDVPIFGDVRTVPVSMLDPVDAVIGGVPCTDISGCLNGSRQGWNGSQSGLIIEFERIVSGLKPRLFVIENVVGALKIWDSIIDSGLFSGYKTEGVVLDASKFGGYTRRNRAFIVGHTGTSKEYKSQILDFRDIVGPTFCTGGAPDVLPMCVPWKGGVSLERLGSCVAIPVNSEKTNA